MSMSKEKKINQYNAEGRKEGWWEYYYDSGKFHCKGNYTNGILNGLWECYRNGILIHKINFENGILTGWNEKYGKGNLIKAEFYVNI